MDKRNDVCAVVVTFNPDVIRFKNLIESAGKQVKRIVVVDNGSRNIGDIKRILLHGKAKLITLNKNFGQPKALNEGGNEAIKQHSKWILILDDDTILYKNAVNDILARYERLPEGVKERVGLLAMAVEPTDTNKHTAVLAEDPEFISRKSVITSGNLIKCSVFERVKFREDFFIDQVDTEFDIRLRSFGYSIIEYNKKLITQRYGRQVMVRGKAVNYYNAMRMYYITRNSAYMLFHNQLTITEVVRNFLVVYSRFVRVNGIKNSINPCARILFRGIKDAACSNLGEAKLQWKFPNVLESVHLRNSTDS